MKNHDGESVDRISATKVSKLLTVLPRALRLLLPRRTISPVPRARASRIISRSL
jgi:hypothetical protein